jgi:hypothetical protein
MKIFKYVFLCGLLIGFSCQKNDLSQLSDEPNSTVEDIAGEPDKTIEAPDKTIEHLTGTLYYSNEAKTWGIRYSYPGTIDNVDIYLIKNVDEHFQFEENKKVKVSGYAYLTDALFPVPAGTTVYSTVITDLTYE